MEVGDCVSLVAFDTLCCDIFNGCNIFLSSNKSVHHRRIVNFELKLGRNFPRKMSGAVKKVSKNSYTIDYHTITENHICFGRLSLIYG